MDNPIRNLTNGNFVHTKDARFLFALIAIILCSVAGLRYNVGADFANYYYVYQEGTKGIISRFLTLDEPGLFFLYWIAQLIIPKAWFSIFLIATITCMLFMKSIYINSNDIKLSVLLFMFVVWHTAFNGVRQVLASAVLSMGIKYIREQKFFKYCMIVFLAFLVHKSAIILLPAYFMARLEINTRNIILITVAITLVLFSYEKIIQLTGIVLENQEYLQSFAYGGTNYISRSVNLLRVLFEVVPTIFFLTLYIPIKRDKHINLSLSLLIIHSTFAIITSFSAYLARMNLYTMPFAVIAISNLLSMMESKNKKTLEFIVVFAFAFFGWYEIHNSSSLNNFQWAWSVAIR